MKEKLTTFNVIELDEECAKYAMCANCPHYEQISTFDEDGNEIDYSDFCNLVYYDE